MRSACIVINEKELYAGDGTSPKKFKVTKHAILQILQSLSTRQDKIKNKIIRERISPLNQQVQLIKCLRVGANFGRLNQQSEQDRRRRLYTPYKYRYQVL